MYNFICYLSIMEILFQDIGYGSIKSKDKENVHLKLEDVKWEDHSFVSKEGSPDEEEARVSLLFFDISCSII